MIDLNDLIGKPFVDGARGPDAYDCWGLAKKVFEMHGIKLPDYDIGCYESERIKSQIDDERSSWTEVALSCAPVPSLVILTMHVTGMINHVGVYIGAGKFIHTREKIGCNIDRIDGAYWKRKIKGFFIPNTERILK